jgi:hypothetical protein
MSHPHCDHVRNFSALLGKFGWTIKTAVLSPRPLAGDRRHRTLADLQQTEHSSSTSRR